MGTPDRPPNDAAAQLRLADRTWSASRRMIARGERPCYRVAETGDGATVHVIELPWLGQIGAERHNSVRTARDAIAVWLGVDPEAFDVERE